MSVLPDSERNVSRGLVEIIAVLVLGTVVMCGSGCSRFQGLRRSEKTEGATGVGTVLVSHWLGPTVQTQLTTKDRSLAGVIARTDNVRRRSQQKQILQELTGQALAVARERRLPREQLQLQGLRNAISEDVIRLRHGGRDWFVPMSLLASPQIASLRLSDGDRVTTLPFEATSFYRPDAKPDDELEIILSGPFASQRGEFTIERVTSAIPIQLADVASVNRFISSVDGRIVFLANESAQADVKLSESEFADTVVVSRLDDKGGLQSLVLPNQRHNDVFADALFRTIGKREFALASGDLIEITNLELLLDSEFGASR